MEEEETEVLAFPVSFSRAKLDTHIKALLESKHYRHFTLGTGVIYFFPFWIFNYDAYKETDAKPELKSGFTAISALDSEILPGFGEKYGKHMENIGQIQLNVNYAVKEPKLPKEEAMRIAPLKIAAQTGFPKAGIELTKVRLVYIPEWHVSATVDEKDYDFKFMATTGELSGAEKIPEKDVKWADAADDAISEFSDPRSWPKYAGELYRDFVGLLSKGKGLSSILANPMFRIILLIILAAIVILWTLGYI